MKALYQKGTTVKVATTQAQANALVADDYVFSHNLDEVDNNEVTETEHAARFGAELSKVRGVGATAARPAPGTVGAGFAYFDTTLNRPIWVNAARTGYVDSAGVAVA